jgi:hypothetical protein
VLTSSQASGIEVPADVLPHEVMRRETALSAALLAEHEPSGLALIAEVAYAHADDGADAHKSYSMTPRMARSL